MPILSTDVLNFVPHDLSDPGGGRVCGTVKGILNLTTLFAELEYYYAIFLLGLALANFL